MACAHSKGSNQHDHAPCNETNLGYALNKGSNQPELKVSFSTQLSMKFNCSLKLNCWKIKIYLSLKLTCYIYFILLINVKMPTTVGILIFMSRVNLIFSWFEHETSFITSGPDQPTVCSTFVCVAKGRQYLQGEGSAVAQWQSAWLEIEGLSVRASLDAPRCVLKQDTLSSA